MVSKKLLKLFSLSLVIVIIVFSIYYDVNNFSAYISKVRKSEEPPYPKVPGIKKIDVGEGDDTWILTDKNELYHWNRFKKTFLYERNHVFDFAVGSDGSIVYIDVYNSVHIRDSISSWHIIYDSKYYKISRISICDYNTIFLVDTFHNLIKGVYDSGTDHYSWDLTPGHFYQASCAFHDYSLWAICEDYVYLYINKFKKILRSEVVFIYIKALSKQHAIGIDSDNTLWEYINGTWTWVRSNVKSASINYSNDIYYVDNNNLIYKKPKDLKN
ncbi:hypothetical protein RhiirA1_531314 [Rhizophagus irregularis]|uniref:Uncharacterized protein n=1 Tax=Rhizophagus irregularis TaxID=588596 RepID=A0A2I1E6V8_9GLOM|nr:hypothetical protein RhiirA1_531314 [Rhizophagus irregularis]PKY17864.1 hypothetical protein RhiirB3_522313 [Rhizophagus irregularis]CAB4483058.1 unnamed protein product [Rhizophagus irregularis]CAB5178065.1 unnamed protein product [Rhizophagus irregularis]CAB5393416.1 unnamed protein product [Rhizophagus irregularis]